MDVSLNPQPVPPSFSEVELHLGRAPDDARAISWVCSEAYSAVCDALRPGHGPE